MRGAFPVLKRKLDRVSSIIPKLYLRPSANTSGRLTWGGQAKLLTDQHSALPVQAALRPMRCKLDAASKARQGASHHDHFPGALDPGVRRVPSKAASCRVGQPTRMAGRAEAPGNFMKEDEPSSSFRWSMGPDVHVS